MVESKNITEVIKSKNYKTKNGKKVILPRNSVFPLS